MILARLVKRYSRDGYSCVVSERGEVITMRKSGEINVENILIGEFLFGNINGFGHFVAEKRATYEERIERQTTHKYDLYEKHLDIYTDNVFQEFFYNI